MALGSPVVWTERLSWTIGLDIILSAREHDTARHIGKRDLRHYSALDAFALHDLSEHGHEPVAGKDVAEDAAVALDHLPGRPEEPVEHGGEHLGTQPLAEHGGVDQIAVQHRHDPQWLAWRVAHFGTGGRGSRPSEPIDPHQPYRVCSFTGRAGRGRSFREASPCHSLTESALGKLHARRVRRTQSPLACVTSFGSVTEKNT